MTQSQVQSMSDGTINKGYVVTTPSPDTLYRLQSMSTSMPQYEQDAKQDELNDEKEDHVSSAWQPTTGQGTMHGEEEEEPKDEGKETVEHSYEEGNEVRGQKRNEENLRITPGYADGAGVELADGDFIVEDDEDVQQHGEVEVDTTPGNA